MNRIRSSKEKRGAAATAPRLVLWQRSINSSSNLSRKRHSSTYAAANTDSETEADMDTWLLLTLITFPWKTAACFHCIPHKQH